METYEAGEAFTERWQELNSRTFDFNDDRMLIWWFCRVFGIGVESHTRIPYASEAGLVIGKARRLEHDWKLSKSKKACRVDYTTWVLTWCMNGLVLPEDKATDDVYKFCAEITANWLAEDEETPRKR